MFISGLFDLAPKELTASRWHGLGRDDWRDRGYVDRLWDDIRRLAKQPSRSRRLQKDCSSVGLICRLAVPFLIGSSSADRLNLKNENFEEAK